MAYTPKPGDASLFKADKNGNDKLPDMRGYIVAHRDIKAGEKIELVMWQRQGKNGGGWFYSGKVSDPRKREEPKPEPLNDEIGF